VCSRRQSSFSSASFRLRPYIVTVTLSHARSCFCSPRATLGATSTWCCPAGFALRSCVVRHPSLIASATRSGKRSTRWRRVVLQPRFLVVPWCCHATDRPVRFLMLKELSDHRFSTRSTGSRSSRSRGKPPAELISRCRRGEPSFGRGGLHLCRRRDQRIASCCVRRGMERIMKRDAPIPLPSAGWAPRQFQGANLSGACRPHTTGHVSFGKPSRLRRLVRVRQAVQDLLAEYWAQQHGRMLPFPRFVRRSTHPQRLPCRRPNAEVTFGGTGAAASCAPLNQIWAGRTRSDDAPAGWRCAGDHARCLRQVR